MKYMTLRRIAEACEGILHTEAFTRAGADTAGPEGNRMDPEGLEVADIVTDSRRVSEGSLFAAVKGEHVDGHRFIRQAFEQGAACVLSEQELPEDTPGCWIKVQSTLQALQGIAGCYLRMMDIPVIGITGSVGKTSTKEMIAAVLSQKYCTLKTEGNFNNELGLPLTVFRLREEHEIAVLEMGINHFGEMHRLAAVARPDTCVITNIGQCHLEFLGDRDGVLRAKTEIFDFLPADGHVVLNGNDDKLITVQDVKGIKPIFFGMPEDGKSAGLQVWADEIRSLGLKGIHCRIHAEDMVFDADIPLPGLHMVMNALAATAVGLIYHLTADEIRAGIASLETLAGRFHMIRAERCTIIDDCYNANPASMKASLAVLAEADTGKTAILGDMFELGGEERLMHRETGRYAGTLGLDSVICIGTLAKELYEGAAETADERTEVFWFPTKEEFLAKAGELVGNGDTVLVKASHGMAFSEIVEALTCLS